MNWERIIRPHNEYWRPALRYFTLSQLLKELEDLRERNPYAERLNNTITPLLDFEIWLLGKNFLMPEFTSLNFKEPLRLYSHMYECTVITIIYYNTTEVFQIDDKPELYEVPQNPDLFRTALEGKLTPINVYDY